MKEAMTLAMKEYTDAKSRSGYGYSAEEMAAYKSAIDRTQTQQITAAGEAGGGQMASYAGALSSANKADNILDMMSKNATLKLQKEQFAVNQLNSMAGLSNATQGVAERDNDRYLTLLREAGMAISDLRMQEKANREKIFNTAGSAMYRKGQENEDFAMQAAKVAANVYAPGSGSLIPDSGGNTQVPQIGGQQNTQYGAFSNYGTQIG
jgi:hypothetical protein